jgi:Vacuolar protein sorting-associated protein 26
VPSSGWSVRACPSRVPARGSAVKAYRVKLKGIAIVGRCEGHLISGESPACLSQPAVGRSSKDGAFSYRRVPRHSPRRRDPLTLTHCFYDCCPCKFSFTTNPTINITFTGQESRAKKSVKVQGSDPVELPVYSGQEAVSGSVDVVVPAGKKIEHLGIKIEMIGQIGKNCTLVGYPPRETRLNCVVCL